MTDLPAPPTSPASFCSVLCLPLISAFSLSVAGGHSHPPCQQPGPLYTLSATSGLHQGLGFAPDPSQLPQQRDMGFTFNS